MLAIARACASGELNAKVAVVIASRLAAPALASALEFSLPIEVIQLETTDDYAARLLESLKRHRVDLLCLAGYLRLVPSEVLAAYPKRVLNIHPALLPKHGGKGMYGTRVHEAVLAAGDLESGCTVHYVTDAYDEGESIVQRRVPLNPGDDPATLAARVLDQEHVAYIEAIQKVIGG